MVQTFQKVSLLLAVLICLCSLVSAQQLNPDKIEGTVILGEQWSAKFTSTEPLVLLYDQANGTIDDQSGAGNDDIHFAKFIPQDGFEGTQRLIVEYVDYYGQKWYTQVTVHVVRSWLTAQTDYVLLPEGTTSITIDVLNNDRGSLNNLNLQDIGPVNHGVADILPDQRIEYTVESGFSGTDVFHYTIGDELGTTCVGKVVIKIEETTSTIDTSYLVLVNTAQKELVMPGSGYTFDEAYALVHGSVESTSEFTYQYKPDAFSEGVEFFGFTGPDGAQRFFEIEVINNQEEIDFVVDDEVYTNVEQYISFDVRDNDYSQEGVIVDYSDDPNLIFGSGAFAYHPPAGFSGVKNFYYVVHDGFAAHRGEINIFVGDYLPQKAQYDLVTRQNAPLILEYVIPTEHYTFSVKNAPSNGSLLVNQSDYSNDCGSSLGNELIVYQPATDFVGNDEFTISYCTRRGTCRDVIIHMSVEPDEEDCHCFGSDCVWSGDTNNDGKVSVLDLLPIGYHYGESGKSRSQTGQDWLASYSEDWVFDQRDLDENRKYVDTDGNGIIDDSDADALSIHYDRYHNIVPQEVLVVKDIPITFETSALSGKAGDRLNFTVSLGSDDDPVLDLQGFAFSIQVPANLIEPGSMTFEFDPNAWFGSGSPVLSLVQGAGPGRIDAGIVRTDGTGISGKGIIGSTGLTIVEDLDGFRPEDDEIPVDIVIQESVITDGSGQLYQIQAQTLRLVIKLETASHQVDDKIEVLAYPNPAGEVINFHANNRDELVSIDIFNTLGKLVYQRNNIHDRKVSIHHTFSQGMYLAHITTSKGKTIEKIHIIRQ